MNRTLVEAMRSMLADAPELGKRFWAEALNTATYLKNRSPTISLPGITPVEAWSGERPDLAHLRVFGCQTYAHVPTEERGKLESKTRRCWMLGYGDNTKAYRLYDQSTDKVFFSRNVKFSEEPLTPTDFEPVEESPETSHPSPSSRTSRTSQRIRAPPDRLGEWVTMAEQRDPANRIEAINSEHSAEWVKAMATEMKSLEENQVWTLAALPKGRKAVGCKWVFKTKTGMRGEVVRYKARLVARGFSQIQGADYNETFSPVVRGESLRTMFAVTVTHVISVLSIRWIWRQPS